MKRRGEDYDKPTCGQVSKMYEEAGDAWGLARNPKNAEFNYGLALKNAYVDHVKNRLKHKIKKLSRKGLEKHFVFAVLAIGSFIAALFFVSFSLTGSTIAELTSNNLNLAGLGLFFLGLVFTFVYFKNKR